MRSLTAGDDYGFRGEGVILDRIPHGVGDLLGPGHSAERHSGHPLRQVGQALANDLGVGESGCDSSPAEHDGNGPTDSPRSPRDDCNGIFDLRSARLGSRFVQAI